MDSCSPIRKTFLLCGCILAMVLMCYQQAEAQKKANARRSTHQQAVHRVRKKFDRERYSTVGLSLSTLQYFGDLSPRPNQISTDLISARPGVEVSVGHKYSPYLKVQSRLLMGQITATDSRASDPYRHSRNTSFKNFISEVTIVNIFEQGNHGFFIHRERLNFYGFVGIGIFHHNPKGKVPQEDLQGNPLSDAGRWVALQPLGTEGQYSNLLPSDKNYGVKPYKLFQPCIPFGFGLRQTLNSVLDLSVEMGFRWLFTDYVDDVSGNYVDLGVLDSPLVKAMSYRTNELAGDNAKQVSYTGRDGQLYFVKPGYGSEHADNKRGGSGDNDFFTVFSVRLCYILEESLHKAKAR